MRSWTSFPLNSMYPFIHVPLWELTFIQVYILALQFPEKFTNLEHGLNTFALEQGKQTRVRFNV